MGIKEDIEKRIEKERQKISDLRSQIELAESFVQGLQEALRLIPRSDSTKHTQIGFYFRSGDTKQAYEELKKSGKPMRIDEILRAIGKSDNRQNRASMASSLHRAAKKSGIIKKVGANTFAVSDMVIGINEEESVSLPDNFGSDRETQEPKDIPF
jgi:hypothetical protein